MSATSNPVKTEAAPLPQEAISATQATSTKDELEKYTVETAIADGVNPTIPIYVITNESDWKPTAVGDHGLARNVAQFHEATFDSMKKEANMPDLEYNNAQDQITLLNWALAHNEGDNWTTFRRLTRDTIR